MLGVNTQLVERPEVLDRTVGIETVVPSNTPAQNEKAESIIRIQKNKEIGGVFDALSKLVNTRFYSIPDCWKWRINTSVMEIQKVQTEIRHDSQFGQV